VNTATRESWSDMIKKLFQKVVENKLSADLDSLIGTALEGKMMESAAKAELKHQEEIKTMRTGDK